jgi:hypothetical protein
MTLEANLRAQAPNNLGQARAAAHQALQLVTKAARANLEALPDDSHSNVGWDRKNKRFISWPLGSTDGDVFVALTLTPLRVELFREETAIGGLRLEGHSVDEAGGWLDSQLIQNGLKPMSGVEISYQLPPDVASISRFESKLIEEQMLSLSAWFDLASDVLTEFTTDIASQNPGEVRCWPHHFDIATYVQLEDGNFETAKGIGVGMSPGDENYDQPYFYVNPWPHMDPAILPQAPLPGHWHKQDFVGAIATGDEVLSQVDPIVKLAKFVGSSFNIGRDQLGA